MTKDQEKALFKAGNVTLRKHAKRHDYTNAVYIKLTGLHRGQEYFITKRVMDGLHIVWKPYVGRPEGLSNKVTVLHFVNNYGVK